MASQSLSVMPFDPRSVVQLMPRLSVFTYWSFILIAGIEARENLESPNNDRGMVIVLVDKRTQHVSGPRPVAFFRDH
jgi:hypothetical protein